MNEYLMKLLLAGEVLVIFKKRENGLLRNMICTLEQKAIPPEKIQTWIRIMQAYNQDPYMEKVVAWDIEKNDWRSFYMDSVLSIEQTEVKDPRQLEQ